MMRFKIGIVCLVGIFLVGFPQSVEGSKPRGIASAKVKKSANSEEKAKLAGKMAFEAKQKANAYMKAQAEKKPESSGKKKKKPAVVPLTKVVADALDFKFKSSWFNGTPTVGNMLNALLSTAEAAENLYFKATEEVTGVGVDGGGAKFGIITTLIGGSIEFQYTLGQIENGKISKEDGERKLVGILAKVVGDSGLTIAAANSVAIAEFSHLAAGFPVAALAMTASWGVGQVVDMGIELLAMNAAFEHEESRVEIAEKTQEALLDNFEGRVLTAFSKGDFEKATDLIAKYRASGSSKLMDDDQFRKCLDEDNIGYYIKRYFDKKIK
ncbi:MAG: hypothetical protein ACI9BD_001339, partial [Candidatus Marinamargulisbacteria bacterium]